MRIGVIGSISDTSPLAVGSVVEFTVEGGPPCSGVWEDDIRNGLNNWLSQVLQLQTVDTNMVGNIPGVVSIDVRGTVTKDVTAGWLRSQVMAALSALSDSNFWTTCITGVQLKDNAIRTSSGGTHPPGTPDNWMKYIPWIVGGVAVMVLAPALLQRR